MSYVEPTPALTFEVKLIASKLARKRMWERDHFTPLVVLELPNSCLSIVACSLQWIPSFCYPDCSHTHACAYAHTSHTNPFVCPLEFVQ